MFRCNSKNYIPDYGRLRLNNKHSVDLPPVNPELCLSRSKQLEQDKKLNLQSFLSQTSHRDISHYFDNDHLGSKTKNSNSENIFEAFASATKRLPTSKVGLENLEKWINDQKELQIPGLDLLMLKGLAPKPEEIGKIEHIFEHALEEIVRQVSVQCRSRGKLLTNIIDTLKYAWKKYPEYLQHLLVKEKGKNDMKLEKYRAKYKEKLQKSKAAISENLEQIESLKTEKATISAEIVSLKKYISKMHWEYEEYLKCKSKKSMFKSAVSQTEFSEDPSDEDKESLEADPEEIMEKSEIKAKTPVDERLSVRVQPLSINILSPTEPENEAELEKALIELKALVQSIDMQSDIDVDRLVETVAHETKNLESWVSGFKIALNFAKYQQIPLVSSISTPIDIKPSRLVVRIPTSSELSKSQSPRRVQTLKFKTFESITSEFINKELINSGAILADITSKPISLLQKHSKNTKKKILKYIAQYIYLGIGKKDLKAKNFSDLILESLYHKYNIRSIAERKFKQLLVGCILYYKDNRRIRLFLSSIGAGNACQLRNFSTQACEIYFKVYEFMMTSKTGVIFDNSDSLDISHYPISRALECARTKFEHQFAKSQMNRLIENIEKLSESDLHRVNKTGVINLDAFVEIMVNHFEEYRQSVVTGVNFCAKIISDYNYLTKGEVYILIRHLAPSRQSLLKLVPFDEEKEIDISDFELFCISNGLFCNETISNFFEEIKMDGSEILNNLKEFEHEVYRLADPQREETLSLDEWENKFELLRLKINSSKNLKYLQLWHILKLEIEYIRDF